MAKRPSVAPVDGKGDNLWDSAHKRSRTTLQKEKGCDPCWRVSSFHLIDEVSQTPWRSGVGVPDGSSWNLEGIGPTAEKDYLEAA